MGSLMISRRNLLLQTAALPFAGLALRTQAQDSIGSATLTTVSDGSLRLPGDFIFEPMPQDQLAPILAEHSVARDVLEPECNLALYRDGQNTVLFDVGSGPDFVPSAGTILSSLDAIGVAAEDITHVVFTHAHPDHIWGLLDEFDDPTFYEATYMMGRAEWDYWWNPETVNALPEARKVFAVGAKRRLEAIEDAVDFFDDGAELLPGITALETPGHTPGHMAFEVGTGSSRALILGDAIANHHIALRRPDWPNGPDQDRAMAAETRLRLLDKITADDLTVIGFHMPNGGIGRIDRVADGYQFVQDS